MSHREQGATDRRVGDRSDDHRHMFVERNTREARLEEWRHIGPFSLSYEHEPLLVCVRGNRRQAKGTSRDSTSEYLGEYFPGYHGMPKRHFTLVGTREEGSKGRANTALHDNGNVDRTSS
jgi:hypothetical protein